MKPAIRDIVSWPADIFECKTLRKNFKAPRAESNKKNRLGGNPEAGVKAGKGKTFRISLSARGGLEHFAHEVLYGIEQDETHLSSPYPQALRADGQGQRDTGAAASELRPLRWRRELREPERKSRSADIFKCKTL